MTKQQEPKELLPAIPATLQEKADAFRECYPTVQKGLIEHEAILSKLKNNSPIALYLQDVGNEALKEKALKADKEFATAVNKANKEVDKANSLRLDVTREIDSFKKRIKENVDNETKSISELSQQLLSECNELTNEFDRQEKERQRLAEEKRLKDEAIVNFKQIAIQKLVGIANKAILRAKEGIASKFNSCDSVEILAFEKTLKGWNPHLRMDSIRVELSQIGVGRLSVEEKAELVDDVLQNNYDKHNDRYIEEVDNDKDIYLDKVHARYVELKTAEANKEAQAELKRKDEEAELKRKEEERKRQAEIAKDEAEKARKAQEAAALAESLRMQAAAQDAQVNQKNIKTEYDGEYITKQGIIDLVAFCVNEDVELEKLQKQLIPIMKAVAKLPNRPKTNNIKWTENKKRIAK